MQHVFRFLGQPLSEGRWTLSAEESHHLSKVLRLTEGETVEVSDGCGLWATCTVETIGKHATTLRISPSIDETPLMHREAPPDVRIILCLGALKPGSLDEILPGLVELGVDAIHLFHQPGSAKMRLSDKAAQRWERLVTQAVKQCKRAWVPHIVPHDDLASLLASTDVTPCAHRYFLSPAGSSSLLAALTSDSLADAERDPPSPILLVVGGEQGLSSAEESQLLAAHFTGVRLGPHILRAVTAAISATAITTCYRDRRHAETVLG